MKKLAAIAVALVSLAGCGEYEREEWEVALTAHEWEQFYPLDAGHPSARAIAYSEAACSKKGAALRNGWLAYSEDAIKSASEELKPIWEAQAKGAAWNELELNLLTTKVDRLTRFINTLSIHCRLVTYEKVSLSLPYCSHSWRTCKIILVERSHWRRRLQPKRRYRARR
jgi:hypothetical protein